MIVEEFEKEVTAGNIEHIRLFIQDYLVLSYKRYHDFREFEEYESYALSKVPNLYDEDDDTEFDEDKSHWTKRLYNETLVGSTDNFTRKRIAYLKEMCAYLYGNKESLADKAKREEKERSFVEQYPGGKGGITMTVGAAIAVGALLVEESVRFMVVAAGVVVIVAGAVMCYKDREK